MFSFRRLAALPRSFGFRLKPFASLCLRPSASLRWQRCFALPTTARPEGLASPDHRPYRGGAGCFHSLCLGVTPKNHPEEPPRRATPKSLAEEPPRHLSFARVFLTRFACRIYGGYAKLLLKSQISVSAVDVQPTGQHINNK